MNISRRAALLALGSTAAIAGAVLPRQAWSKLTEANMTQRDYDSITETESSVDGQPKTEVTAIHDLSDANKRDVETAHGVRMIKGGDWKKETPKERDAHLRRIMQLAPEGSRLVLSVPKGEVWLIPPGDDGKNYDKLKEGHSIREWTEAERAALPASVGNPDSPFGQSDRHGTTFVPIMKKEKF